MYKVFTEIQNRQSSIWVKVTPKAHAMFANVPEAVSDEEANWIELTALWYDPDKSPTSGRAYMFWNQRREQKSMHFRKLYVKSTDSSNVRLYLNAERIKNWSHRMCIQLQLSLGDLRYTETYSVPKPKCRAERVERTITYDSDADNDSDSFTSDDDDDETSADDDTIDGDVAALDLNALTKQQTPLKPVGLTVIADASSVSASSSASSSSSSSSSAAAPADARVAPLVEPVAASASDPLPHALLSTTKCITCHKHVLTSTNCATCSSCLDVYREWFGATIIKQRDGYVSLTDAHVHFVQWLDPAKHTRFATTKQGVKQALTSLFGCECQRTGAMYMLLRGKTTRVNLTNVWRGYAFRNPPVRSIEQSDDEGTPSIPAPLDTQVSMPATLLVAHASPSVTYSTDDITADAHVSLPSDDDTGDEEAPYRTLSSMERQAKYHLDMAELLRGHCKDLADAKRNYDARVAALKQTHAKCIDEAKRKCDASPSPSMKRKKA